MAERILAHSSGTRFFPDMRFVQEHSKSYQFSLQNNSRKINDQIFQGIQNTLFLFQKCFSRKSNSVLCNFIWVHSDTIPTKYLDRQRDGRSDRRMKRLFYRTLTAMLGDPEPLQSQYIGYWYHAPYLEKFIKIISLRINTSNNSKWKLKKRLYFLLDIDDSPAPTRYCKS